MGGDPAEEEVSIVIFGRFQLLVARLIDWEPEPRMNPSQT